MCVLRCAVMVLFCVCFVPRVCVRVLLFVYVDVFVYALFCLFYCVYVCQLMSCGCVFCYVW